MKRRILRFLVLAMFVVGGGGIASQLAMSFLPSTADLTVVREETGPSLQRALSDKDFRLGDPVFIRIFKESSELEVWLRKTSGYALFKVYPICNYSGELGPKLKEGDRQSPEGFYFVGREQLNPNSSYHLSFNLGFPNTYERSLGRTGSFLMVHGNCVSIGCYAMTDAGIEEIYLIVEAALNAGQEQFQVQAFPFRMTEENVRRYPGSRWLDFWRNLKEGYDVFEATRVPPKVRAGDGVYEFSDGSA